MNDQIQKLIQAHRAGTITRRDFIQQTALLIGGATVGAMVVAGGESDSVQAQGPTATLEATMAATGDAPDIQLVTKAIEFKAGEQTAPGYLAYPASGGPFPAAIVIQEWWGVDAHIKSVVELLARNGFAALASDLYHGEVAAEPAEAQKLAMSLIIDQAIKDVQGAADYLTAQSFVSPKRAGVMGFCMGGRIAMMMSWLGEANIGAVASFYGGNLNPTDQNFKDVKVPVLSLYGELDRGIPVDRIRQWEAKFKEFGKINETVVYEGAGHAFFNDARPAYNPGAARDALRRTLTWFGKYLM